ncbi:MAG TPA: SOS response-associated peptidase [Pyrinomonadaceae bacterium]|nr:SOS response-associated peptidase [Pyrinomonadaceae bacterium]
MCGRYTNKAKKEEIEAEFKVNVSQEYHFEPRYNIAPTQIIDVVLETKGERIINQLKWGLIPGWAKDDSLAAKMINARAETLAEKPSFKNAFKSRRCIIPATGFFEWKKTKEGKQPFYFHLKDKELFGFAGLYENWLDKQTGELLETCTIITTEANTVLQPIHERMPVILKPEDYDQWLDEKEKDTGKLQNLLMPYSAQEMDSYQVSKSVNSPFVDSPELIEKD